MSEPWEDLRDQLFDVVEKRAKKLLDDSSDTRAFLRERLGRLAKLTMLYYGTKDPEHRAMLEEDMKVVQKTVDLELAGLALDAEAAAKESFFSAVSAIFGTVVKAAPFIGRFVGLPL